MGYPYSGLGRFVDSWRYPNRGKRLPAPKVQPPVILRYRPFGQITGNAVHGEHAICAPCLDRVIMLGMAVLQQPAGGGVNRGIGPADSLAVVNHGRRAMSARVGLQVNSVNHSAGLPGLIRSDIYDGLPAGFPMRLEAFHGCHLDRARHAMQADALQDTPKVAYRPPRAWFVRLILRVAGIHFCGGIW
jgi:hypothetical protein